MSQGSARAQIPRAFVSPRLHLSIFPEWSPVAQRSGPFFDKLNLESVSTLVESHGFNEAHIFLRGREESAMKRVLYSESGL